MAEATRHHDCYARWSDTELLLGNDRIERSWRIENGALYAVSLRDKASGREWLRKTTARASLVPSGAALAGGGAVELSAGAAPSVVGVEPLVVRMISRDGARTLQLIVTIHPRSPAITLQLIVMEGVGEMTVDAEGPQRGAIIDDRPAAGAKELRALPDSDVIEALEISPLHLTLTAVDLREATDVHQNLVSEERWLLHPSEAIAVSGNLFSLQDNLTGHGLAMLKHAPLPYARPVGCAADLYLRGGTCVLAGHGLDGSGGEGYASTILVYAHGDAERTAELHAFQRRQRTYEPSRDGLLLCNTWGDRSRDGRISEVFMLQEIEAAARLGADVLQIDDGWQQGLSQNSVTKGGVWDGFWAADADFWVPHKERFPRGLAPVVAAARARNLRFGLWYAPDSSDHFANWRRDANAILGLHRELGIDYFKVDAVKMRSKRGERNIVSFYHAILAESGGKVVIDQDITDEVRPGLLSVMEVGPVFVENRYSDWGSYFPHATLRNLWMLSRHIDPVRLRMEFLNNARNADKYPGDPLAPARYAPAYLFATVMFSNPLGWFEVSNLPEAYIDEVAALVAIWKRHRAAVFAGSVIPIGDVPDGASWTGFAAVAAYRRSAHVLVFRELHGDDARELRIPLLVQPDRGERYSITRIAGEGEARCVDTRLAVTIPRQLAFAWFLVETAGGRSR